MLQLHDRLDDYEIIRLLGRGGMGEVYEARQTRPDRPVAVKVLAPWLAKDDEALQRFWREAEVPANLDHPGIVHIISCNKTADGVAYYAMSLVRGISLAEMIRRGGAPAQSDVMTKSLNANTPSIAPPPPSAEAPPPSPVPAASAESSPQMLADFRTDRYTTLARIGVQAARALAFAHQQGHLHRDIKPSNLMVDHHDHVYLVDFGLTRGLEAVMSGTQPGIVVGTPWYMSPEQADGKKLDVRSDIYSLGVTLYELATLGLGPFTANREDKHATLAQVRAGQVLPLRSLAPGIPPELERIIVRAMELKPRKRHVSAAELATDLERFLGISSKHSPAAHLPSAGLPRARRRWPMWIAAAVVLIGLAATIGTVVRGLAPLRFLDRDDKNATFTGKKALPEDLRTHRPEVPFHLAKNNHEPLFKEVLYEKDKGGYIVRPFDLRVWAREDSPFIMAIADPDRHNFDFAVDVSKNIQVNPDHAVKRIGIVFGWQRRPADSDRHPRFFIVEFDDISSEGLPFGQLKIGSGWLVLPGADHRAEGGEWYTLLPKAMRSVPLRRAGVFQTVQIQVRRDRVTVGVLGGASQEIAVADIRRADPRLAKDLDPRGTIALWAQNGGGQFRNPTITLLED